MDLLLYLVSRKEEVDIYDIPIARITEQYCAYIEILRTSTLISGDFLVMAANADGNKIGDAASSGNPEQGRTPSTATTRVPSLFANCLNTKKFKDAANLLDASASSRICGFREFAKHHRQAQAKMQNLR